MARAVGKPRVVDAEQFHRRGEALLGGKVEDDRVARLDRQPGVLRELVLQLARRPAGVTERAGSATAMRSTAILAP